MNNFIKRKLYLLILVLVGGGLFLTCVGVLDIVHTRQLIARGKGTTATVLDRTERTVYKENKSHHLLLAYQTEDGRKVNHEVMVVTAVYNSVKIGGSLDIVYDPNDPSVCKVGNNLEVSYGKALFGLGFVGAGIGVIVFARKKPNLGIDVPMTEDAIAEKVRPQAATEAQKIVKGMAMLMGDKHEYEAVDARRFTNVDLQFYDDQRRFMESRGFLYLQDSEDVTLRNSKHNPKTFVRVMLRKDGLISAGFYHFKPPMWLRVLGVKELKVLDLNTQFSNGTFICTSNSGDNPQLSQPAEIKDLALPGKTSFEQLIAFHQQRMEKHAADTGASPVRLEGMAGVRKADDELWRLKAGHRQRVGLTRDDLKNLSGTKGADAASNLLYEEVQRELGRTSGTS